MAAPQTNVNVKGSADKIKLIVALTLFFGGLAAYFLLAPQGNVAQFIGLLVGVMAAVTTFAISSAGRSLWGFAHESFKEVRYKVVFPNRKDALQTTLYVLLFSVTMSIFLWLTDKLLGWILYDLILGWR